MEEGFARWHMRVWMEQIANYFLLPILMLGGANYVLPFRKRMSKDLPAWVAARSFHMFTVEVPDVLTILLMALYSLLDAFQTPGGLHLSDAAIDKWKSEIEGGLLGDISLHYYGWNWWNYELFSDEDRCANVDGAYAIPDAGLDIIVTVLIAVAVFFIAKNFGSITGKIGGIFGKQMSKRRRKKMKGLALENIERTETLQQQVMKILEEERTTLRRVKQGIVETLEEDVVDDLDTIKKQTRRLNI